MQLRRRWGMNRVISLVLIGGFVVLALAVGFGVSHQIRQMLRDDLLYDSFGVAEQLAADSRLALLYRAPENVAGAVRIAQRHPDVIAVTVIDTEFEPLVGNAGDVFDHRSQLQGVKQSVLLSETENRLLVAAPVFIETQQVIDTDPFSLDGASVGQAIAPDLFGYVVVDVSKRELQSAVARTRGAILVPSAAAGIALFLILYYLVRRITAPLERLATHMTDPETPRTFRRAPVSTVVRETAQIGDSFNELIAEFERIHELWVTLNAQLEAQITERTKEAEEARDEAMRFNEENRALIRAMNAKLEEERRYVVRELHDQLNANLVALKLTLSRMRTTCRKEIASPEQAADRLNKIADSLDTALDVLNDMYEKSRHIVRMLRPEVIDSLSLVGAIEDTVNNMGEANPDWSITFDATGDYSGLSYETQIALYRIVQESLNNVAKHADAKRVHISLHHPANDYPEGILLAVEDDGVGFDPLHRERREGTGLLSMRERAYGLGGHFQLISEPGQGTRVLVTVPMETTDTQIDADT